MKKRIVFFVAVFFMTLVLMFQSSSNSGVIQASGDADCHDCKMAAIESLRYCIENNKSDPDICAARMRDYMNYCDSNFCKVNP
jgi:hypothetical protein